jgi:hypothetical protein
MKQYKNSDLFHYDGKELNFSVADCLNYTFGDLINNTTRGAVAEYIVAKALDIDTTTPRQDWLDYDLIYKGNPIEVKASGYLQPWNEANDIVSNIVFSIKASKDYDNNTRRFLEHRSRKSSIYIFCVLKEKSKDKIDATDLTQWQFYIVPTRSINEKCGEQRTISLNWLKNLFGITEVNYNNLKAEVDKLL